jgi:hypothetical protein
MARGNAPRPQMVVYIMPKPKRHHFVPEFYLFGFTRDGMLSVYDREKNEFRRQPPKNTAVIGHYYAFINNEGETDYSFEGALSQIEGLGKAAITKLNAGEDISPEERVNLAYFIALLFSRTPKFEREIEQIADSAAKLTMKHMFQTAEAVEAHFAAMGRDRSYSAKDFLDFIHDEKYSLVGNRNITIRTMLQQMPEVASMLACMDWLVIHTSSEHAFITGDSPFALLLTDEQRKSGAPVGLGSPTITKAIPLTRTTALLVGRQGLGFGHADGSRDLVRVVNVGVAAECEQYVFGPDEALVRSVVKRSKIDRSKPGTQLRVDHVLHPTDSNRTLMVARRVSADAPNEPLRVIFGDEAEAQST